MNSLATVILAVFVGPAYEPVPMALFDTQDECSAVLPHMIYASACMLPIDSAQSVPASSPRPRARPEGLGQ